MNRADFMNQLESLLQSIAPTEREEAIQYYNDYFDDAGAENEREVIEALGNPARVAENIKRDLLGNGYGEKPVRKAQASDRALMEYGKDDPDSDTDSDPDGQEETGASGQDVGKAAGSPGRDAQSPSGFGQRNGSSEWGFGREPGGNASGFDQGNGGTAGFGQQTSDSSADFGKGSWSSDFGQENSGQKTDSSRQDWSTFQGYGKSGQDYAANDDEYRWSRDTAGWFNDTPEAPRKAKLPVWAIAMLVTVLIVASPVLAGILLTGLGLAAGIVVGWFGTIFGFGVAAVCLFAVFVVLLVTGILCCFTSPWVGMAMVGAGLICGCMGILFLMLTVAMAGIVTPAIFRGIGGIFRFFRGKRAKRVSV